VLDGEAIDAAAKDPEAIAQLTVDTWGRSAPIPPTGGGLYYGRNSHRQRRLQAFETGSESLMSGGWVRRLVSVDQVRGALQGGATC
jgi:hypothetical protein